MGMGNSTSTLMCPAHRKAKLRKSVKDWRKTCPVEWFQQALWKPIDVDFPVGYRALAGLDLVIQAAGRVNREMKLASAEMFVFVPIQSLSSEPPPSSSKQAPLHRQYCVTMLTPQLSLPLRHTIECCIRSRMSAFDSAKLSGYWTKEMTELTSSLKPRRDISG